MGLAALLFLLPTALLWADSPKGEARVREMRNGHWQDLGLASDWERNHREISPPQRNGGRSDSPPQKTAAQLQQEAAEAEKLDGLNALAEGKYERAINLLSHARASLPQDTTITDKLREARTALVRKLTAESDATRHRDIENAIQRATVSLEALFASQTITSDPMVVDLTDSSTLTPQLLSALELPDVLPPPPTGPGAGLPEPNPNRLAAPTDEQMLAYFSGRKFEEAFFEYQVAQQTPPPPTLRLHQVIEESLKLLDTVPMRPLQIKSSAGMDELEATRPHVAKAVESFKTRYYHLRSQAMWRAVDEYKGYLTQLEKDGWWKRGEDIRKAIAANPELSKATDEEAGKVRRRMLDYLDTAAETAYAELANKMRAIMKPGENRK